MLCALSFACFEAYKKVGFVRNGENGHNAFPTGAKIHFSKKKYFGVRGTLKFDVKQVDKGQISTTKR